MSSPYLVKPRIRFFLYVAAGGVAAFAILAVLIAAQSPLVQLDTSLADCFYHLADDRPWIWHTFIFITNLGAGRPLYYVGAVSVLYWLVRGETLLALLWAAWQLASRPVTPWLKLQFARQRPEFAHLDDFSFPSGHAFGSALVYGLIAYLLWRVWAGSRWRSPIVTALLVWIGLIALSRMMLGVHHLSDVVAGVSLGIAYAAVLAAITEWWLGRRSRPRI